MTDLSTMSMDELEQFVESSFDMVTSNMKTDAGKQLMRDCIERLADYLASCGDNHDAFADLAAVGVVFASIIGRRVSKGTPELRRELAKVVYDAMMAGGKVVAS